MEQLGRYHLQKKIGQGAMGEVYRAVLKGMAGFQKLVALKVLFPFGTEAESMRRDLIKEAKIGAMLHHPNVVETYELGPSS